MATTKFWLLALVICFGGLRWYRINERLNFTMDQGVFMLRAREIWDNKELTLLGPTASPVVEGRQFFQGPVIYYALLKMGLWGHWDPLLISGQVVLISLMGIIVLYLAIKNKCGVRAAIIGAMIMTFWPINIRLSNFIWNPNFLWLITPLLIYVTISGWWLVAGIVAGIGLQFHFQMGLIILIMIGWMIIKKREALVRYLIGLIVGYLPLIIFDLRNNFYNVKTIWLWLTKEGGGGIDWQWHYFIAVSIWIIFWGSKYLARLNNKILIILLIILITCGIREAIKVPGGWQYRDLLTTEKYILEGKEDNFNVVDMTSGDSRFYSLRYLLRKDKRMVEGVDEYPKSKVVYALTRGEIGFDGRLWEIEGFGVNNIVEKKQIREDFYIYKLKR